jgi:hypothetical protein
VRGDGGRGGLAGAGGASAWVDGVDRAGPEAQRIRVEPEDDLALARGDALREAVREVDRGGGVGVGGQGASP